MSLDHIVMLGMPGSGKGTQSKILLEEGYYHFSTGELFRGILKGSEDEWYDELAKLFARNNNEVEVINQRLYVNHNSVNDFFKKYLESYTDKPTIIDGYPRTIEQARFLDSLKENYIIVYLDIKKSEAERRLLQREESSGRMDDAPQVIMKRMQIYHENTLNLIPYYRLSNIPFVRIDANNDIDTIAGRIRSELQEIKR